MGEEKPKTEEVLRRIDELLDLMRVITDDLTEISKTLRATISTEALEFHKTSSFDSADAPSHVRTVEDVQKAFPSELSGMLYFEVTDDYVLVKPRQFLGSDNFAKIASIVRDQLGGEYVSKGRDSHFKVSRKLQRE